MAEWVIIKGLDKKMGANKGARLKKKKKKKTRTSNSRRPAKYMNPILFFLLVFMVTLSGKATLSSLLNGTKTLKGKTFLVGPVKERLCFKGSKLSPSRVGPIRGDSSFSEPTGSDELNFPADKDMM